MMLIFGLMLLLQAAACVDRLCWLNQSDICYAALGHKLNLLMPGDMKIQKNINYNKSADPVCHINKGKKKQCDLYSNRPDVTLINRTLIINPVIRADRGNYTITHSHSDGTLTTQDLQVKVEVPIGSVEVSITCSSSGVMRASCSSEGDQILYSWTLNEHLLKDRHSSIDLMERAEGNISCRVKNHVSDGQKTVIIKPCPEPAASNTRTERKNLSVLDFSMIALACVALILILLFITVYHIYKKKQVKSTPAAADNEDIVYADISHKKKSEKKKTEELPPADVEYVGIQHNKKRKEQKEEVQYGEVTFTKKCTNAHTQPQEECIYSQVHTY